MRPDGLFLLFVKSNINILYRVQCRRLSRHSGIKGGIINTIFNKLLVLFNREEGGIIMWYLQVCQVASATRILLARPLKDEGDSECVTLLGVLQE